MFRHGRERAGGGRFAVAMVLLAALAVTGGASRADEDLQALARLAAVGAMSATLWPLEFEQLRRGKALIAGGLAVYALVLAQLVPLPPNVWAAIPGHAVYAEIADAGGAVTWRPLSLTPDLTRNALFALLPATAAGLAMCYLGFRDSARLVEAIVAVGLASAVLGLMQVAAGNDALRLYHATSEGAPVGLFANRNHQAALLACTLPLAAGVLGIRLRRRGNGRLLWPLTLAIAILLLIALALTGSRMGLALGALGLAGSAWTLHAAGVRLSRRHAVVALGGAALLAIVVVATARGGAVERLAAADPLADTRVAMLPVLLRTAASFLPFGAGFGAFDDVYRQFEPDTLLSTIYMNQAHDEPLQLAIEGGMPAIVLLGVFGWWWARRAGRVIAPAPPSSHRAMGIAVLAAGGILMASSLVDYPLRTPLLGAVFIIVCVALDRAAQASEKQRASADFALAAPA